MRKRMMIILTASLLSLATGCAGGKTGSAIDESKTAVSGSADSTQSKAGKDGKAGSASDGAEVSGEDASLSESDDFVELEPDASIAEEAGIILDESVKQEILEEVQKGSLDVENDTFEFENMTSFIGKTESELIALIGAEGHPEGFATKLFGEDVRITTTVDGENVTEIKLVFPSTDKELLINALGEQLGTDPEESEGVLSWTYLGKVIRQQDIEEGILVTVSAEE